MLNGICPTIYSIFAMLTQWTECYKYKWTFDGLKSAHASYIANAEYRDRFARFTADVFSIRWAHNAAHSVDKQMNKSCLLPHQSSVRVGGCKRIKSGDTTVAAKGCAMAQWRRSVFCTLDFRACALMGVTCAAQSSDSLWRHNEIWLFSPFSCSVAPHA